MSDYDYISVSTESELLSAYDEVMTHFKATNFPLALQMTEFASYRYPECVGVMRTICSRFPEIGDAVNKQIEIQRVNEVNQRPKLPGFTFCSFKVLPY